MNHFFLLSTILSLSITAQIPFSNAKRNLDKNYVKAPIGAVNNKFWLASNYNSQLAYEVPKGKGVNATYYNNLWIGGKDQLGKLHLSNFSTQSIDSDFWPGPLDTTNIGAYNASATAVYNTLWKVDCNDINSFTNAYNNGQVFANTYTVPADIATYPAKGIGKFQKNLEPFYDANANGMYNPATEGDYPLIKGHQQILTIYNDTLGGHFGFGAPAMGLEIHERAYAYSDLNVPDSMNAINYSTFYNYTIYNRSSETYSNVFISILSDADLGYYLDDFIGTDTLNHFAYLYNGANTDPTYAGVKGYGNHPPVLSHTILKTPCTTDGIDNNHNGQIDEPGEQFLMDRVTYYNNNIITYPSATTNPSNAASYYGYMAGRWMNGIPFTYGGIGYGGTQPTHYVYPGDPATNSGWTEASAGNPPGDRRLILSSGPLTIPAGAKFEWAYALVFSQDTTQATNTISQFHTRVQRDVRNIRYYDAMHQNSQCVPQINTGISYQRLPQSDIQVYPNPAANVIDLIVKNFEMINTKLKICNMLGCEIKSVKLETEKQQVDISELPQGVYFIEINNSTQKFIKE